MGFQKLQLPSHFGNLCRGMTKFDKINVTSFQRQWEDIQETSNCLLAGPGFIAWKIDGKQIPKKI